MKIYKYTFEITHPFVNMHEVYKILHFEYSQGIVTMWAIVNSETEPDFQELEFVIVGTGHPFNAEITGDHLATVLGEGLVWHIFEKRKV